MDRFGRFELQDGRVVFAAEHDEVIHVLRQAPWLDRSPSGEVIERKHARQLCPVQPSKILCIGRNYADHAREMNSAVPQSPLVFLKPPSSLLDPEGVVILPPESTRVEHEAELGVVIGRRCRRVPIAEAMQQVFGYCAVADITARDLQQSDGQWTRAKGFDTFCPVGPSVVAGIDPSSLSVIGYINGVARQRGNTRDMVFDVARLVSHLSQAMTLEPGDLIATGTPAGVGPLVDGDEFVVEIETVGRLRVSVAGEARL